MRITARLLFFAGLCSVVATPVAVAQQADESDHYKSRYMELYRNRMKHPENAYTYVLLAEFYADSVNPMANYALAMDYIQKAERRFVTVLQDPSRFREANRMIKSGMKLGNIRETKARIVRQTTSLLDRQEPISDGMLQMMAEAFAKEPAILNRLMQVKVQNAYGRAEQERNADAYYSFLLQYSGTAEADSAEAYLARWASWQMPLLQTIAEVDRMALRYEKSLAIQRAAAKRKGAIAFEAALDQHTEQAYLDFIAAHPTSEYSVVALDMIDTLTTDAFYLMHTPQEYVDFTETHGDNPLADQAMEQLCRRIEQGHDALAARLYLERFPLDANRNRIYQLYYGWHGGEGNWQPVVDFERAHPDYPHKETLQQDRTIGAQIDAGHLSGNYNARLEKDYVTLLRYSMGKRMSLVILQRILQPLLDAQKWGEALRTAESHALVFDEVCHHEYEALKQTLRNGEVATPRAEPMVKGIKRPVMHPDGNRIFYSQDGQLYEFVIGNTATSGRPVHIVNGGGRWIDLQCFYDGGNRMIVGIDGNLYSVQLVDGAWHLESPLPEPINSRFNETDAYMLADGSGMLFVSDRPEGCNIQQSGSLFHGDRAMATDIYFVSRVGNVWGDVVRLSYGINSAYCEQYPVMSRNGTTLYFVTDGGGGMGFGDIYTCERLSNDWQRWSTPINLGRMVNSGHREAGLTLSADEQRLYYTSDRNGSWQCYSVATSHNRQKSSLRVTSLVDEWDLSHVEFTTEGGEHHISYADILDQLAQFLALHSSTNIDIECHYKGRDSAESYLASLQRGEAIRRYLATRGVNRHRIAVSAYGNASRKGKNTITARMQAERK
mgnify:CR=1 FL=1